MARDAAENAVGSALQVGREGMLTTGILMGGINDSLAAIQRLSIVQERQRAEAQALARWAARMNGANAPMMPNMLPRAGFP
jgi:hypothetical protein